MYTKLLLRIIYDNMQIKQLKSKYYKSPVFSGPFGNGKKNFVGN